MDLGDNPASLKSTLKQRLCEKMSLLRRRTDSGTLGGERWPRGGSARFQREGFSGDLPAPGGKQDIVVFRGILCFFISCFVKLFKE